MRRENKYKDHTIFWGDYDNMIYIDDEPKKGTIEHQYCELNNEELIQKIQMKNYIFIIMKEGIEVKIQEFNFIQFYSNMQYHLRTILGISQLIMETHFQLELVALIEKNLTKLSTYLYCFRVCNYESDWQDTLKTMMKELGNKEVVFLVSDSQIDDKILD